MNLTFDDGDKILTAGSKNYAYDAAGRTTSVTSGSNVTNLTYDYESRLATLTGPGISSSYSYNGLDTRVSKIENSVSNPFVRDGIGVTAPVIRDTDAAYTSGVSERRGSVSTFNFSGLKNAELQTSATGATTSTKQHDAYGAVVGSTGTWSGPFGYAGDFGYQEDASGLKLLGHRYYDSSTGRFLTRDVAKDGRNWYAYCENNPLSRVDPDGNKWFWEKTIDWAKGFGNGGQWHGGWLPGPAGSVAKILMIGAILVIADSVTTTHPAPPIGGVPIVGLITVPVPKFDDNINDVINGNGQGLKRNSRAAHDDWLEDN